MRIDMAGIGHDKDVSDERFKAVYGVYDMAVKYEGAFFLLIAVFGLPRLDLDALMADPTSLLAAIPFLGLAYDWKKFEVSTLIKNFKSKSSIHLRIGDLSNKKINVISCNKCRKFSCCWF